VVKVVPLGGDNSFLARENYPPPQMVRAGLERAHEGRRCNPIKHYVRSLIRD